MTGTDTDVKEVEKMFAVNVFGPMRMVHFFHPQIIPKKGRIVNIGSVGGIVPYVFGCEITLNSRFSKKDADRRSSQLQCQ
jgi:NAD(P)-dependent dehydrogenase (short-subunit alcohol dehydrogenase family)